ncbi:MAG TPA: hypothetical protein VFU43_27405 [Streptosporangiaceae bacterium]|nr:hypothetical protein [Streptosporangiaceae bacterium]
MSGYEWIRGPFGPDAIRGATIRGQRTALVVAHHLTAGTRLADVLPLLESDRRIQVVYSAAPASPFSRAATEFLERLGGLVLPWHQATQVKFDLAIAASHGMLENLHAPILTMPHGAGPSKLLVRQPGLGPPAGRPITGVIRERIIVNGRVVPSTIIVGHEDHRSVLARECPEALPVVVVAGDPCFDRLMSSVHLRNVYRHALGVGPDQRLVFVSSTWSPGSLLGQHPDLLLRIAAELPREKYCVVAALHPNIWGWSGRRQVVSWHADCMRLGVRLLPPEEGWRAALIAADRVIGDHGSVTFYAAAMGVPVLLGAFPEDDVVVESHVARLGAVAPRLDWNESLRAQVDDAIYAYTPDNYAAFRGDASSRPGMSASILRREMYRLMRLALPEHPVELGPVPPPYTIQDGGTLAA